MLIKIHPKIEEALRFQEHGTIIDGAFASQAIDTSGEVIDVKGTDISSLNEDGVLNVEHASEKNFPTFSVIIGRIIFAKKIFTQNDCESERELKLWNEIRLPFIYGAAELFDKEDHSNAKDAAAMIKHYHRRGLPVVIRYSIEGSTIDRNGNYLVKTIARRVAATIKPCNKSSYSALVSEPTPAQVGLDIEKNEKYIAINEMEYDVLIDVPMSKTLTLGSYNAAPSELTGGSALQKEDIIKRKFFKNQLLAAARDYDGREPFREYLKKFVKHSLPDVADKYLDKYSDMVEEIQFRKNEDQPPTFEEKGVKYKDKTVKPGEIELVAGPFKGSKLKLMHVDDTHVHVKPPKASDQSEVNINKINRKQEGSHFVILSHPEELHEPKFVDSNKHVSLEHTKFNEQKDLVHGIDLNKKPESTPHTSTWYSKNKDSVYGWFKNNGGKTVHVKPNVDYEDEPEKELKPSTASREVLFHNLSRGFFGIDNVPTTALFKHPDSGEEHSAMEVHPEAVHYHPDSPSADTRPILHKEGITGQLDKMALMDSILGNRDRNRTNYMIDKRTNKLMLIDNALTFDYNKEEIPSYLEDYARMKGKNVHEKKIHPEAREWLMSLDPFQLKAHLDEAKVHPEIAKKAVQRLLSAQSASALGNDRITDLLFANKAYGV
jgi:hypothetical protein